MGKKIIVMALGLVMSASVHAENLLDVFRQAYVSDPTFQAAKAQFNAVKQDVPLNVANFLPQVGLVGSLSRDRNDNETGANPFDTDGVFHNDSASYGINLHQSIFNYKNWASLANASARSKQQGAILCAAYQDLLVRTARAYFNVLTASENLRFNRAEKRAIGRQLEQSRERFKVGLIAITAVYEAQASYDAAVASEIAAQNDFANRIEELREITGVKYQRLKGLRDELPLMTPRPTNIESWVQISVQQNYNLLAARYAVQAARENIKLAVAGHLPVIDGNLGFNYAFSDDPVGRGLASFNKQWKASLDASLPVFNGGAVVAQTRQARFYYQQACAQQELSHRSVMANTRKSYLGIISGASRIKADQQTIKSRESALKSTEAAFQVGTRTMVDVLDASSRLYQAQQIYSRDRYDYLLNILLLKQEAGTVTPNDLAEINRWFKRDVSMIPYGNVGTVNHLGGPSPENIKASKLSKK